VSYFLYAGQHGSIDQVSRIAPIGMGSCSGISWLADTTELLQDEILLDGLADRGDHFVPGGSLRRSSSKKLKMKLTLFTAAFCSAPGAFNTAKRLPSGCRSKL
jgi:hypothetical protein